VAEADLASRALARSAGAAWVKVIADFPALPASQGPSWSLSITHADPDNLCRSLQ
jgi:hypothetical protein